LKYTRWLLRIGVPVLTAALAIWLLVIVNNEEEPVHGRRNMDRIDSLVQDFFNTGRYPSLSVGLVQDDTLIYSRALGIAEKQTGRPATVETIYELGSVGKVLTTTVLAVLHVRGVVSIDDPVQKWLPDNPGFPKHPSGWDEMTLEHLATHTSGLPGIPVNVGHLPSFQWPGYSAEMLHDGLHQTELLHPPGTELVYSSLGTGLLGHILSIASGESYEKVIEDELLSPLGMTNTVISLRDDQKARNSTGYESNESFNEVPLYEYGVLAGCGAHRSTVSDLARFVSAQWECPPDRKNPLTEDVRSELHRTHWQSDDGETRIALGWFVSPHEGLGNFLGHRGRTPGHSAFVGFILEQKAGVIILTNRGGRETSIEITEFGERILLDHLGCAQQ